MFEKIVVKKTEDGAIIPVTTDLIGKTVWVATEDDALDLQELVEHSLLMRRIDKLETKAFSDKFNEFQREVLSRITRLENIIYGTKQEVPSTEKKE